MVAVIVAVSDCGVGDGSFGEPAVNECQRIYDVPLHGHRILLYGFIVCGLKQEAFGKS